jgi:hypothetical protein
MHLNKLVRSIFFGSGAVIMALTVVIFVKGAVSLFSYSFLFYLLLAACVTIIVAGLAMTLTKGGENESREEK